MVELEDLRKKSVPLVKRLKEPKAETEIIQKLSKKSHDSTLAAFYFSRIILLERDLREKNQDYRLMIKFTDSELQVSYFQSSDLNLLTSVYQRLFALNSKEYFKRNNGKASFTGFRNYFLDKAENDGFIDTGDGLVKTITNSLN